MFHLRNLRRRPSPQPSPREERGEGVHRRSFGSCVGPLTALHRVYLDRRGTPAQLCRPECFDDEIAVWVHQAEQIA
jgi:hypothetical protein